MFSQLRNRLTMAVLGLVLALSLGMATSSWQPESVLAADSGEAVASASVPAAGDALFEDASRLCASCWR